MRGMWRKGTKTFNVHTPVGRIGVTGNADEDMEVLGDVWYAQGPAGPVLITQQWLEENQYTKRETARND